MGAGNWPQILKLGHNIKICLGRIFDILPSFCVTWLWNQQKRQFWRVYHQSRRWLIFNILLWLTISAMAMWGLHTPKTWTPADVCSAFSICYLVHELHCCWLVDSKSVGPVKCLLCFTEPKCRSELGELWYLWETRPVKQTPKVIVVITGHYYLLTLET